MPTLTFYKSDKKVNLNKGSVRLASLCLPRGPHSGEPLYCVTIANRTITLALSWWRHVPQVTPKWSTPPSRALGDDPGEPRQSYSNVPVQTAVDPGKLNERTQNGNAYRSVVKQQLIYVPSL